MNGMSVVQDATQIECMMTAVNQRVADFAAVANTEFETAASFFTVCQQLNFMHWLEGRLCAQIEDYATTKNGAYADLVRQRRIITRRRESLEAVVASVQQVAIRPLPDFASARMMDWAKVGRIAIRPGIADGKAQIVIGHVPVDMTDEQLNEALFK